MEEVRQVRAAGDSNQAVVLLYPGCTIAEIIESATRLADRGVNVVYASPTLDPIRDHSGLLIQPEVTIDDLDTPTIDVVIVPGGDPAMVLDDVGVFGLLHQVVASGGFIAAICAGTLLLAATGLTRDRSITHNYRSPWAPAEISEFTHRFWEGARVEPDPTVGVVVDMPIITALPNATIDFSMAVCCRLGLYTPERASLIGRHLRGEHVRELLEPPS